MLPAQSRDMIRACQRRATSPGGDETADRREARYHAFRTFLAGFLVDLNVRSADGWRLLVEGKRDERALRSLGYEGILLTVSRLGRSGTISLGGAKKVIVLTDLDREGAVLASKYVKKLAREGVRTSLEERRRLRAASRGVFLHVENLARFATSGGYSWEPALADSTLPKSDRKEG